jgi:hypothetical protein
MRTWLSLMLAATFAVSLASASTAAAATEFGDNCGGNTVTESEPNTYFEITAFGNSLPLTAPTGGGITQWKVNDGVPAAVSFPQTLKVLRLTGPTSVRIVGEATGTVVGGLNVFSTRIPIQASDRLAMYGTLQEFSGNPIGNLYCQIPGPENEIGVFAGSGGGPGAVNPFVVLEAPARFPLIAVVEPDADGDGYGDETQDQCPQSAAVQTACPVVTLSTVAAVQKALATISVTASSQASVTVAGTVKLGKGKTAKLSGGTQIVAPGTLAKFKLLFPQKLQAALKALPKKRSLTLTVTASAPNVVGSPTTKTLKLHLKGQAKPKKPSRKKAQS